MFHSFADTFHGLYWGEHGREDNPLVAVIRFAGDYSEDAAPQRVAAFGGYIAPVEECDRLSDEWLSVIHDKAWPSPITRYHATDCESQQGEFESWSPAQCVALTTRLVDVILNPAYKTMEGIGGAVVLDDLSAAPGSFPPNLRRRIGYLMTSQLVFAWALGIPLSRHGDRIEFVFDNQPDLRGRVLDLFDVLRNPPDRELVPALKFRLEEPIFRDSRTSPPLQAADRLAYNTQKHLANLRFEPQRPIRRSLERLIEGRMHRGACIDRRFFAEITRRDAAGESLHFQPPDIYRTTLLEHEPPYDRD